MSAARLDHVSYLMQGDYYVSGDPTAQISTLLGSCVAACLWDKGAAMGGMNHFLLPSVPSAGGQADSLRYGINAMEVLINALLRMGARRSHLEGKLFGGARISQYLRDIGASNAEFARSFLAAEDIPCRAASLGGTTARRVIFRPTTGQAHQLLVPEFEGEATSNGAMLPFRPATDAVTLF
jgi:chemotaxis protein CheD